MATTFIKIASVTVGSGGASSIDFTSIPATYTDLQVLLSVRSSTTGGNAWVGLKLRFNSSTSGYTDRAVAGNGSTAFSFANTYGNFGFLGDVDMSDNTASTFGNTSLYCPNYAGSQFKSYSSDSVQENNATLAQADLVAGLWSNTSAITSINLTLNTGNFVQHSTATLYGISKS